MTTERELVEEMTAHVEALQQLMRQYRDMTGQDLTGVGPTSAIDRLSRQLRRKTEHIRYDEEPDEI